MNWGGDESALVSFFYEIGGRGLGGSRIKTDMALHVGVHTDEETNEAFYAHPKDDIYFIRALASTDYYFNNKGDYRKISSIPNGITDPSRKPLKREKRSSDYESRMTAGDFELAGQVIQGLINKLKPQEKPAE